MSLHSEIHVGGLGVGGRYAAHPDQIHLLRVKSIQSDINVINCRVDDLYDGRTTAVVS